MKLLNPKGCLLSLGGGNDKKQTTLVEGEWMGFRTWVRIPPGPYFLEWGIQKYPPYLILNGGSTCITIDLVRK